MVTKEQLETINQPAVIDLLYDLGLMPEQVKEGSREEWKMLVIAGVVDNYEKEVARLKATLASIAESALKS